MTDVAPRPLRVLSLCAGYGGLDLGIRAAFPSTRTVCYVERDAQAAAVLARAMGGLRLDSAPIWSDLVTLPTRALRGAVDLVAAGFPCQPVSQAGKRRAQADERWLWPHVSRIIAEIDAPLVFLENVPGLVSAGLRDVLRDLAALGFDAEWDLFSAADVGAPHIRGRWFCLAWRSVADADGREPSRPRGPGDVARTREPEAEGGDPARCSGENLADPDRVRCEGERIGRLLDGERTPQRNDADGRGGARHAWPPTPDDADGWARYKGATPSVRRGADGSAGHVDRLRILGNGVVPAQAALALRTLAQRAGAPVMRMLAMARSISQERAA